MKCVNCMGSEEYTNGLCFQCYLKTVPPGKVIEYNPKKFDLNKQLTTLKVCSKCNREIPQHEPAWVLLEGGYCCENCRIPEVTKISPVKFPGTSDPVSHANLDNYRKVHNDVLAEISDTDIRKDHDYGRSFSQIYEKFGMQSSVIRLWDKMNRLERLTSVEAKVKDESIRDTLLDLANYAIKTIVELDVRK